MTVVRFDSTSFGKVVIDRTTYGDVLVVGTRVLPRKKDALRRAFGTSHALSEEEVERLLEDNPQAVIIGTGQSGLLRVEKAVEEKIKAAGAKLILLKTPEAIEKFNEISRNNKVNALIHTTC